MNSIYAFRYASSLWQLRDYWIKNITININKTVVKDSVSDFSFTLSMFPFVFRFVSVFLSYFIDIETSFAYAGGSVLILIKFLGVRMSSADLYDQPSWPLWY